MVIVEIDVYLNKKPSISIPFDSNIDNAVCAMLFDAPWSAARKEWGQIERYIWGFLFYHSIELPAIICRNLSRKFIYRTLILPALPQILNTSCHPKSLGFVKVTAPPNKQDR